LPGCCCSVSGNGMAGLFLVPGIGVDVHNNNLVFMFSLQL